MIGQLLRWLWKFLQIVQTKSKKSSSTQVDRRSRVVKIALQVLKIGTPVLILGWLLWKEQDSVQELLTRPKDLRVLLASLVCMLTLTCISFVRWYLLVRALDIPFTLRDAMRLGFLGYLLNFVGPGAVGGDLFKAYFVARDQKERRAEAVATILIDRVVGMFCLFCVATVAILFLGPARVPQLQSMLQAVVAMTVVGALGIGLLLMPGPFTDWIFNPLSRLPLIGNIVARIRAALELYRKRRSWLILVFLMGVCVHSMLAVTVHLADRSIHTRIPTLQEHLIISPLASVASAAPVPGGLGTFELAMDQLFERLPVGGTDKGQGLRVAVIYRLLTIMIAGVGAIFYAFNRSDVSKAVTDIESEVTEPSEVIDETAGT